MARMTREESQAQTRARLIRAAGDLFGRDGYRATSVDRIAEAAGFSKGAFYSNFDGKSAIFQTVLDTHVQAAFAELLPLVQSAPDYPSVVERLAAWAESTAQRGNWALLVPEHVRHAGPQEGGGTAAEAILRGFWGRLGEAILARFPLPGVAPELLGALICELAYAPAMTFVRQPGSGDLVRLALSGLARPMPASSAMPAAEARSRVSDVSCVT